jgi:hypothetical protein
VESGEKESVGRRPRAPRAPRPTVAARSEPGAARYSDVGRAAIDRLVELGREAAELRATARSAREESREARQAKDEAEARARTLAEKVRELEARAEMAESNLRTMLATVRAKNAEDPARDAKVSDSEMEAILGVLKGGEEPDEAPSAGSVGSA